MVVIAIDLLESIPIELLCFRQGQMERGLVRLALQETLAQAERM